MYSWGWNDQGQLGFPNKNIKKEDYFSTFEHDCNCKQLKNILNHDKNFTDSETSPNIEILINENRNLDSVNVQASPKLLDFWSDETSVIKTSCGDRHTLFLLGKFLNNYFGFKIFCHLNNKITIVSNF